jgi:hypothetical protein
MGYFRPIQSFNVGKRGEAAERTYFRQEIADGSHLTKALDARRPAQV